LALVVTEIALRWKMTQDIPRVTNPHELRAERYQELVQGLALLGLTTCAVYWKSGMSLATITVVALDRLYGDLKIVPWVKGLAGQAGAVVWTKLNRTYFDIAYEYLEAVGLINLCEHVLLLNARHPMQSLLVGAATFALPDLISKIFERMVNSGYWDLPESRLSSLKIERMQTFMRSLLRIRTAAAFGQLGMAAAAAFGQFGMVADHIHFLGPKTIKIENLLFFISAAWGLMIGGFCVGSFLAWRKIGLERWYETCLALKCAVTAPSDVEKRLFFKYAYCSSVWEHGDLVADMINVFRSNVLTKAQIERLFSNLCMNFKKQHIVKVLNECNCLPPDFLSTKLRLWKCLNDDQIQTYLLTPEIKQLLQEDNVVETAAELQKLTKEIGEAEKASEKNFSTLRPLRERIEKLSFAKVNDFLSRVPNNQKPIVVTLNSLKTKVQQREKDIAALEQRLETLCEDVKVAYEGIPHLREEDMKQVLEQAGITAEGQPGKVLFNLLAILGIKWKGDLVMHHVLQSGDNANRRKLLIERLVKFIKERNV
jgi:hypothetical protein